MTSSKNPILRSLGLSELHAGTTESQVKSFERSHRLGHGYRVKGIVEKGEAIAYVIRDGRETATLYPTGLFMSGPPVPSWRGPDARYITLSDNDSTEGSDDGYQENRW